MVQNMPGRTPGTKNRELPRRIIDALVSLWRDPEQAHSFMTIHRCLVEKGIVSNIKNKMTTTRILRRALALGILEYSPSENAYRLKITPDEESYLFSYLESLRRKYKAESYNTGSCYGTEICNLYMLGIPDHILKNPKYEVVLRALLHRLSHIFGALLALSSMPQECADGSIPSVTLRQLLLELIPYHLEHDGKLTDSQLKEVLDALAKSLKAFIDSRHGYRIYVEKLQPLKQYAENVETDDLYFPSDVAMVLTSVEPEDERLKRDIIYTIDYLGWRSSLVIADGLLGYYEVQPDDVRLVLNTYGVQKLGREKVEEVMDYLEKMALANTAGKIIREYLSSPNQREENASKLQKIVDKIGAKTLLTLLPIVDWGMPYDESWAQTIVELLPFLDVKQVKKWEEEGKTKYEQIILERIREEKRIEIERPDR